MRVLLTCDAAYSHFMPMVAPMAQELQAAGHQVAVATDIFPSTICRCMSGRL